MEANEILDASAPPVREILRELLSRPMPPVVARQPWRPELRESIRQLTDADATANVRAALHLMNDDLDPGHVLVQPRDDDATSSYWHGIIHRREGDFGNAKYWMRRTGDHPAHAAVLEAARSTDEARNAVDGWSGWDATRFVDVCEQAARSGDESAAAELQWAEMRTLLRWCLQNGK